jgi:4'-phosphopantetheinyl transferase EntD
MRDMSAEVAFRIDLPHGRCVGVSIPAGAEHDNLLALGPGFASLTDDERTFFESLSAGRKPTWLAGRIAMHEALRDLGIEAGSILTNKRGAPELPVGVTGSISHKRTLAVALAARQEGGLSLGVDLEPVPASPPAPTDPGWDSRPDISNRVMTPEELTALATVAPAERRHEVVLHFSLKEALYKAINPLIGRYVSFQEASVLPHPDGSVTVALALAKQEGPFVAEARWSEIAGHLLTTAAVRPVAAA